mmetsp:Transcript_38830/g.112258  ORF Transcript_38830/g.112258 Transcript_38830/m.112258 type:complete len:284 (+) Transcript_38830:23-874(+)
MLCAPARTAGRQRRQKGMQTPSRREPSLRAAVARGFPRAKPRPRCTRRGTRGGAPSPLMRARLALKIFAFELRMVSHQFLVPALRPVLVHPVPRLELVGLLRCLLGAVHDAVDHAGPGLAKGLPRQPIVGVKLHRHLESLARRHVLALYLAPLGHAKVVPSAAEGRIAFDRLDKAHLHIVENVLDVAATEEPELRPHSCVFGIQPVNLQQELLGGVLFVTDAAPAEDCELDQRRHRVGVDLECALEAVLRRVHFPVEVLATGEAQVHPRLEEVRVEHDGMGEA